MITLLARLRPARSRAAIASIGSPTFGAATFTGCANPGVAGRLRAIGSRPLAQAVKVTLSSPTLISDRPLRDSRLKSALDFIVDLLGF